jgi:ParB family transcriptional regulator, chromosome partitioning protein
VFIIEIKTKIAMDGISGPSFSSLVQQPGTQNHQPLQAPQSAFEPAEMSEVEVQPQHDQPGMSDDSVAVSSSLAEPGQVDKVSYSDAQIQEIDIAKVVPNPYQPRKVFDQAALEDLAASIKQHGVIQPIVVTETPTGYELVAGERRFRASILAELAMVPAIVKKSMHDQTKLEVALIENIQRQELNPIEEAQAYERLIKTFRLTQEQVAKKLGKSRPAITNTLRLLNLPAEIQRAVIEGKLSEGHARALLGLVDREKQLLMYQQVIEQGWNVRQVEAKVRELSVRRQLDALAPDPKLMAIETELRGKLGTQVKIQRQGRGGKIMIEFFSDEELADIIARMAEQKQQDGEGYFTV